MQVAPLADAKVAREYYETRYAQGYMDRWEAERRSRLLDVLREIELPHGARVLDYGCGSGALTSLLAERWPSVEVTGVDISSTAVALAAGRQPGVRFEVLDCGFVDRHRGSFDFVFSHHVLEHVFDLAAAIRDLATLLAPSGRMLHALPCGNPGSLPHWLCEQRPDGIDRAAGNRFYFEEPSHLRRLRSDELATLFAVHDVTLERAAFGYHWLGAVRLFTEMAPRGICVLLNPFRCYRRSRPRFAFLLPAFLLLAALRLPSQILVRSRRMLQQVWRFRTRHWHQPSCLLLSLLSVPALCLWPLSAPIEALVRRADRREWQTRRRDPGGSEMMLVFARQSRAGGGDASDNLNPGKAVAGFPQCSATNT